MKKYRIQRGKKSGWYIIVGPNGDPLRWLVFPTIAAAMDGFYRYIAAMRN